MKEKNFDMCVTEAQNSFLRDVIKEINILAEWATTSLIDQADKAGGNRNLRTQEITPAMLRKATKFKHKSDHVFKSPSHLLARALQLHVSRFISAPTGATIPPIKVVDVAASRMSFRLQDNSITISGTSMPFFIQKTGDINLNDMRRINNIIFTENDDGYDGWNVNVTFKKTSEEKASGGIMLTSLFKVDVDSQTKDFLLDSIKETESIVRWTIAEMVKLDPKLTTNAAGIKLGPKLTRYKKSVSTESFMAPAHFLQKAMLTTIAKYKNHGESLDKYGEAELISAGNRTTYTSRVPGIKIDGHPDLIKLCKLGDGSSPNDVLTEDNISKVVISQNEDGDIIARVSYSPTEVQAIKPDDGDDAPVKHDSVVEALIKRVDAQDKYIESIHERLESLEAAAAGRNNRPNYTEANDAHQKSLHVPINYNLSDSQMSRMPQFKIIHDFDVDDVLEFLKHKLKG